MAFVHLDSQASRDIRGLFAYVKDRSGSGSAARWIEGLLKRVDSLETDAGIWPLSEIAELANLGVREVLYRRYQYVYRIFFQIEGDHVFVRRIRSAFQDALSADDFA